MSFPAEPLAAPLPPAAVENQSTAAASLVYPHGARIANWFSLFNALSWQITLGSPIVLYAKSLRASETVLGIIASLMPLLVILQLPAAKYLPKYGYRRFILAGWGSRTIMIFAIAGIPFLAMASPGVKLTLLVACLFMFNLLRGMASGAWMPWMSELVPDPLRATYLSRDQVFQQIGSLGALAVAGAALSGENPAAWQFAIVFLFSAVMQTASLWYVKRIPDVTAPEQMRRSGHRVPWKAMLTYPPFFRLMVFNLLYWAATGGVTVFTVAYLKSEAGYSESHVIWFSGLTLIGALVSVSWVGRVLDRHGSKLALGGCMAAFLVILAGWWAVASNVGGHGVLIVATLSLLTGAAQINWTVCNNRLMMATMPVMGRNHFFALFIVITSFGQGISPIAWGLLLDGIGGFEKAGRLIEWNRYSIYFGAALGLAMVTLGYTWALFEKSVQRRGGEAAAD